MQDQTLLCSGRWYQGGSKSGSFETTKRTKVRYFYDRRTLGGGIQMALDRYNSIFFLFYQIFWVVREFKLAGLNIASAVSIPVYPWRFSANAVTHRHISVSVFPWWLTFSYIVFYAWSLLISAGVTHPIQFTLVPGCLLCNLRVKGAFHQPGMTCNLCTGVIVWNPSDPAVLAFRHFWYVHLALFLLSQDYSGLTTCL